ncbi:PadR family transcriptional regulator [Bacillus dicomae]|uniref:PadR family transcriptional regulator n=1 Tax=Bacillus dicomae TaxID=3088378 RepID=A0AC61SZE4_9BACI|nr:PadR family transcriptional regulator [Bacillus dicomae]
MSNRRYNEKIVDISGEIADIFGESPIYYDRY